MSFRSILFLAACATTVAGCSSVATVAPPPDAVVPDVSAPSVGAPAARRFSFGFAGGRMNPEEEGTISTWNDVSFGCNFETTDELNASIAEVDATNKLLIDLTRAWRSDEPGCAITAGTLWSGFNTFRDRLTPLLQTLGAHRDRILAFQIFRDPDAEYGGPRDAELQWGIDYMRSHFEGVPVFVSWKDPAANSRLANVDWVSAPVGENLEGLASHAKPMFVWWSNDELRPPMSEVLLRWQTLLLHHFSNDAVPVAAAAWCCDAIEKRNGAMDSLPKNVNALLLNIGMNEHTYPFHGLPAVTDWDNVWEFFFREESGRISTLNAASFPQREKVVGSPTTAFPPSALNEDADHVLLAVTSEDGQVYTQARVRGIGWSKWSELPGLANANGRPVLARVAGVTWVAVRDGASHLQLTKIGGDVWHDLGTVTSDALFDLSGQTPTLRVFGRDKIVYERAFVGGAWQGKWAPAP